MCVCVYVCVCVRACASDDVFLRTCGVHAHATFAHACFLVWDPSMIADARVDNECVAR